MMVVWIGLGKARRQMKKEKALHKAQRYWDQFSAQVNDEYKDHWIDTAGRPVPDMMYEEVASFIKSYIPSTGQSVAEIGCGTGKIIKALSKLHSGKIVGIDFSEKQIEAAKVNLKGSENIELFAGDFLRYADESEAERPFDLIFLHSVTQYFPSHEYFLEFLSCCSKRLTRGGSLIMIDVPITWNDIGNKKKIRNHNVGKEIKQKLATLKQTIKSVFHYPEECTWIENIAGNEVVTTSFTHFMVDPEDLYKYGIQNFEIFEQLHQRFLTKPAMYKKFRPIYAFLYKV